MMKELNNILRVIFFLALTIFIATPIAAASLDSIVAVINDSVITQSQLNQQLNLVQQQMRQSGQPTPSAAQLRREVLQHIIDNQLQLQIAKKEGITVDDVSLEAAIAHIAQQNGLTLAQLQAKVPEQGMSYQKYREEIREQMIISQLQQREVAPKVFVTDQEVTDFLPKMKKMKIQNKPVLSGPVFYHVQDYLVTLPDSPTPQQVTTAAQTAQTLLDKLRAGADISQLNVESADLDWRDANELPAAFASAVQGKQIGDLIGPLREPNGYHVLKLLGVRGGGSTNVNAAIPATTLTHVRHILIKTTPLLTDDQVKARLEKIRAQILSGASFAKLAEADSQDPGSAANGGDLGWVSQGMLDPSFEAQMNRLKSGEVSQPFKSSFGWHIVQVLARKNQPNDPDVLRAQARQLIYQRKFAETLQTWLRTVRSQSYVKIMGQ